MDVSDGQPGWLGRQWRALLAENAPGIAAERSGWHDRRKQQWKNYERRGGP